MTKTVCQTGLNSDDSKVRRMTENELRADRPVISVFGSHAPAPGSRDYETAREMGRLLAEAGYAVATGGYEGVMSAASQGASEAGGLVIGVSSAQIEASRGTVLNRWVEIQVPFESLEDRLIYLVRSNDGMVVLPGGIGTLSEFALAWSYIQVGEIARRPLILLGDIWSQTIEAFVQDSYVQSAHRDLIFLAGTAEDAVRHIRTFS